MLLNFLTPASVNSAFDPNASGANYLRIFANPKAIQTDWYVEGDQLVDFKIDFLNKIPLIWLVFARGPHHRGDLLLRRAAEEAVRGGGGRPPTKTSRGSSRSDRDGSTRRGRPTAAPSLVSCHHPRR